jgi:putative nucleotidyltransferase with HDIG domain
MRYGRVEERALRIEIMVTERLKPILDGIRNLPPWPPVATRVLALSQQEEVVPSELASVIQTDAALTAKVLKLCNSSYYGFQRHVLSLRDAGNLLGTEALVSLVLTTCAAREFHAGGQGNDKRRKNLWERSVMNALAADLLASVHGEVNRHHAYTAALLQNIGHLVIDDYVVQFGDEVRALRRDGVDMLEAEKQVLGIHHGQIGARLARRWELPEILVDAIENHHTPERAGGDPMLVSITHLAESVTYALALGEGLDGLTYAMSDAAVGLTGMGTSRLQALEDHLLAELRKARELVQFS